MPSRGSGSSASPEHVEQEGSTSDPSTPDKTEAPSSATAPPQPEPSSSDSGSPSQSSSSEDESEADASDEAIVLPPPDEATTESESDEKDATESGGDDDTIYAPETDRTNGSDGPERTKDGIDYAVLQEQIVDAQEQLATLDVRLDEQQELVKNLQDHLERISRRLNT